MRNHTKVYMSHFGYALDDFIPCEVCGNKAVDIHHLECRGMGGSKDKDNIKNLQAVCRNCHIEYGDKKEHLEFLQNIHNKLIS